MALDDTEVRPDDGAAIEAAEKFEANGCANIVMPRGGRLDTMAKAMPTCPSRRAAAIVACVRTLSCVTSVPSTSQTSSESRCAGLALPPAGPSTIDAAPCQAAPAPTRIAAKAVGLSRRHRLQGSAAENRRQELRDGRMDVHLRA